MPAGIDLISTIQTRPTAHFLFNPRSRFSRFSGVQTCAARASPSAPEQKSGIKASASPSVASRGELMSIIASPAAGYATLARDFTFFFYSSWPGLTRPSTWIPGSSPGMTIVGWLKLGDDDCGVAKAGDDDCEVIEIQRMLVDQLAVCSGTADRRQPQHFGLGRGSMSSSLARIA